MSQENSDHGDISGSEDELSQFGIEGAEDRIWTAEEEFILRDSVKAYRATPKKEKTKFVRKVVARKIKELMISKYGEDNLKKKGKNHRDWLIKKKQIFNWMGNHARTERALKMPGLEQRFNFMKVVTEMKRGEILEEAKRLAAEAGKAKYLGFYQQARTNIRSNLTTEEIAEYEVLQKKWNEGTVPPEVQITYAQRYSKKILSEMNRRNFISMGMRSIIMESHMGPNNRMVYSFNDSNALNLDHPRVLSFSRHDPAAVAAMTIAYKKYVLYARSVIEGTIPVIPTDVFHEKSLTYHPGGMPIIPDKVRNKDGRETSRIRQSIIRTYLNKHFSLAGGGKASAYLYIGDNPSLFFKKEHFPAGVKFKEPSRYTAGEACRILKHWRKRQSNGDIPFMLLSVRIGNETLPADYPATILDDIAPIARSKDVRRGKLTSTMKHVLDSDEDSEARTSDSSDDDSTEDSHHESNVPANIRKGGSGKPRRLFGRTRNQENVEHRGPTDGNSSPTGNRRSGDDGGPVEGTTQQPHNQQIVNRAAPPGGSVNLQMQHPVIPPTRTTRSMVPKPHAMPQTPGAPGSPQGNNRAGMSRKKRKRR